MFYYFSGEYKAMNVKPLHDRILIQRIEPEESSAGGIILTSSAQDKPMRGKVIAAGPGKMLDSGNVIPLSVKAGDEVLFGQYSGTEIKMNGSEYMVMREDDIMGIIE